MSRQGWTTAGAARRLAAVRFATCAFATFYFGLRLVHFSDFAAFGARAFRPVGIAQVLSAPLPAALPWVLTGATIVAGAFAALGLHYRVSGKALALLALWTATYRNSWGMLFHTENLLVLHLILLAFAPAADRYVGLDWTRARGQARPYGAWLLGLSALTATTYLVAGVAKLKASGIDWGHGDVIASHVAYDALRKLEFGRAYSPLGAFMVVHGWVFAPLAWGTLGLELLAPLALWHPRAGRWFAAAAWGFHLGVLLTMFIVFAYPLSGIAYASLLRPEAGVAKARKQLRRFRRRRNRVVVS